MRTVAISKARAEFSAICRGVVRTGHTVRISRRGRTCVLIAPCVEPASRKSIWEARREFERIHGPLDEELKLPKRSLS